MTTAVYSLADDSGTLCVTCTMADSNEPRAITNYWPTLVSTYDFLTYHFDYETAADRSQWPALLATFAVRQTIPGEYRIEPRPTRNSRLPAMLQLTHGARTQSVKAEVRPIIAPKSRGRVEWSDGRWHKETAKGWKTVEPILCNA